MDATCLEPENHSIELAAMTDPGMSPLSSRNTGTLRAVVGVATAAIISAAGILGYLSVDQSPADGSGIAAIASDTSLPTTTAATTSTSAITTLPASTSTAAAVTTTAAPPTTAGAVVTPSTANTPQLPANEIDFSSPLLSGYALLVEYVETYSENQSIDADLNYLTSTTGVVWNKQMLLALSASYCNDWDRYFPDPEDTGVTSTKGYQDWSSAIAPVLGISTTAARQALDSLRWQNYPPPCD